MVRRSHAAAENAIPAASHHRYRTRLRIADFRRRFGSAVSLPLRKGAACLVARLLMHIAGPMRRATLRELMGRRDFTFAARDRRGGRSPDRRSGVLAIRRPSVA